MSKEPPALSELETQVMQVLWRNEECSADAVRRSLARDHELADSTVRTLLRRLEKKGYAYHVRDGKRFLYRPRTMHRSAAAAAARRIIDKLCGGDANAFVLGMLEDEVISPAELKAAQRKLAAGKKRGRQR